MPDSDVFQQAAAIVAAQFPGQHLIPQYAAALTVGVTPRAARQRIKAGKPLFNAVLDAGRYYVTADELTLRLAERLAAGGAK